MQLLSAERRKLLLEAARSYRQSLPGSPGESHLRDRGLDSPKNRFGLGFVENPAVGHERFAGMLAIPYVKNKDLIVQIRFRCILDGCEHHGHGKYNTETGDTGHLYNTLSLQVNPDVVVVCEGEMDAIASEFAGVRAVGVPGANSWKKAWRRILAPVPTVIVVGDGDEPGRMFTKQVQNGLPGSRAVELPDGTDINSLVVDKGPEYLKEILRID